ncbi:hypothetical protein [Wolbachia endosymbiont of Psylliodes chrysocephala]|uniref:hypothetical protein n=1 Tax=Wolbachia endosymbiont of Psylliodes chrysocephala TaxID=2883236 RepID=UPI0020A105C1|nr:hypothetical protein [Wolbachia endosymbiont of Psylliodes chrysocephala]
MTRASFAFFLFSKFLNIYSNMNWAGRCHSSAPVMSSQCPDYLDPENLTLNKWLHNKD